MYGSSLSSLDRTSLPCGPSRTAPALIVAQAGALTDSILIVPYNTYLVDQIDDLEIRAGLINLDM